MLVIVISPRHYSYPKILVFAVSLLAVWRYARVPSIWRAVGLATATACALQMRHHFGEPHDRERLDVVPGLAAGGAHLRPGDAGELRLREASPQLVDQRGAEQISRGFAGNQCDAQRGLPRQRTRLRVDSPMKSIMG
jgi:hypothetical protein